jgi:excisionase family DNA binding protein
MLTEADVRIGYSVKEVAEALGIAELALRRHIERGALPSFRLGARVFISRATLVALVSGELDLTDNTDAEPPVAAHAQ